MTPIDLQISSKQVQQIFSDLKDWDIILKFQKRKTLIKLKKKK